MMMRNKGGGGHPQRENNIDGIVQPAGVDLLPDELGRQARQ